MTDSIDMSDATVIAHLDEQYEILKDCLQMMDSRFRSLMLMSALVDSAQRSGITLDETLNAIKVVWSWQREADVPDPKEIH
jgi:hypothetical protein